MTDERDFISQQGLEVNIDILRKMILQVKAGDDEAMVAAAEQAHKLGTRIKLEALMEILKDMPEYDRLELIKMLEDPEQPKENA
jgi:hypothetical protein